MKTGKKLIQIIGAGQMGSGIAHVCLMANYHVHLVDISEIHRRKSIEKLENKLNREQFENLTHGNTLLPENTYFIIEAIIENRDLKKQFWNTVQGHKNAYLASNTSSYSITELASFTENSKNFIGLHFMNPVPKMPLVEVIKGHHTSHNTYKEGLKLIESLSKKAITVMDRPGFVVNRILIPMINEAIFIFDQGIASAEDIDRAMTLGANHPLGPLALADLIGLDVCLAILQDLHSRLGEDKYRPCPLLHNMVNAGTLGRKSGQGFFTY